MGKDQHVTKHENGWKVIGEGNKKATGVFDTQKEAIEKARSIAKNQESEVVIHRSKGGIRDSDSYGNDPNPPKDKKH
ncbi:DUF2188 domain-containing protein [Dyadobacter chenwenxiniae]|uniref:DUF2188 domain-containing protein n=1 Tax=Dyadobacter chenwenxiniae TaxID=2906456 RepID=A0A9X1PHX1_9BACT|nr:DUF2188 domain-containing protein [Dyadobacter chenwenxiniae]MCF0061335.1 DUF2188 domain-containing protein [Dyadobacter chenwenxiniae]UON81157.1 DUF2188 domain-containing protein [Dyadobacter chenwenxiniae]